MTWRERAREAAERRLRRLIEVGEDPVARHVPATVDEHDADGEQPTSDAPARLRTGPWPPAAVRGLILLTIPILGLAGYLLWQAQPRAVAPAPEVLATGQPITGALADAATSGVADAGSMATEAMAGQETPVTPAPPPATQESTETASAPDVVVHVAGKVARPGLVRLPGGSRVADAVEAAGGVTGPRAAESVNLARLVVDGEQIYVGGDARAATGAGNGGAGSAAPATSQVDLNLATVDEFDALPGIGPVIAGRIVDWRTTHGRFRSVDELAEVSGIGEAILTNLRPLVRV